jgi:preprotein translocase subunit SecB
MLAPVSFEALYQQALQQAQTEPDDAPAATH